MTTTEIAAPPETMAPWWHTGLLVAFFLLTSTIGAALQHSAAARADLLEHRPDVVSLYLSLIALEWGLVYYVWKGALRPRGISLRAFIGARWTGLRAFSLDLLVAIAIWSVWRLVGFAWARWPGTGRAASISSLLPHSMAESFLWAVLSISAGFAEELVFRGYLQRQLTAFIGRAALALVLQVLVFACAHGYQGLDACLIIAINAAILTAVALWRKTLFPGIMAHAWTDIAGGLLN
jgi:membrane protease YdiL (CAAX protease family)